MNKKKTSGYIKCHVTFSKSLYPILRPRSQAVLLTKRLNSNQPCFWDEEYYIFLTCKGGMGLRMIPSPSTALCHSIFSGFLQTLTPKRA